MAGQSGKQPAAPAAAEQVIIPLDMCQELKILGKGKTVGLKVLGILTDKGVIVENVDLLR